jgi:hypothetical protein
LSGFLRQSEENDLPENSRFWLKGTHSGGHVGLLPQGWGQWWKN